MDRISRLLDLLRGRDQLTTAELARALEVSERTVRRDLAKAPEYGAELVVSPGRGGGVRLVRDTALPALRFTDDEALALALALGAAVGDSRLAAAATTARTRLMRVLHGKYGEALQALSDATATRDQELLGADPIAGQQLLAVALATARRHRVLLDHRSATGVTRSRPLDPYAVLPMAGHWYVTGFCGLRRAVRTFRIDRISNVHETDLRVVVPADFDAAATVAAGIRRSGVGTLRCEILFLADAAAVRRLAPQYRMEIGPPPHHAPHDACVGVIAAELQHLDRIAHDLLGWDVPTVIITPPELRDACRRLADRATALAEG